MKWPFVAGGALVLGGLFAWIVKSKPSSVKAASSKLIPNVPSIPSIPKPSTSPTPTPASKPSNSSDAPTRTFFTDKNGVEWKIERKKNDGDENAWVAFVVDGAPPPSEAYGEYGSDESLRDSGMTALITPSGTRYSATAIEYIKIYADSASAHEIISTAKAIADQKGAYGE